MGAKFGGDDDLIADINITPFVDIVLVVLIIFMVTANTIVKKAIPVTLPDAATGEVAKDVSLGLTMTADGSLLLDGQPTTADGILAAIDAAKNEGSDVICLIAADRLVSHGRVVWLLDLIRSRGVAKFAINIDDATKIGPDPAHAATAPVP